MRSSVLERDEAVAPDADRQRRPIGAAAFVGLALLVAATARMRYLFTRHLYYDGDFAANAILIDKARHFDLFIGNYSRVGFNHPGPALLYVQAWSDVAFRTVLPIFPEPYNAHLFGVILLNCLVLATVTHVVRRDTGSNTAAVAFTFVAVLFYGSITGGFTSAWMPDVYLGPFLLYLVASTSVLAGRVRSLPYFVVACGLLVHGHVSFVPFAVVMTVAVVGRLAYPERGNIRAFVREERRTFVVSGCWLGLFVLPIAVNLLVHWPGEVPDYYRYAVKNRQQNRHGLHESLRFVASYWPASGGAAVLIAVAAAGALVWTARRHPVVAMRRSAVATLVVVVIATLLFLQYAAVGVDFLSFRYVGYFSVMVPALLLGQVLVAAITAGGPLVASHDGWRTSAAVGAAVVAVAAVLVVSTSKAFVNPFPGDPRLPAIVQSLRGDARRDGRELAVQFQVDAWPTGLGVVQYARHHGLDACVANEFFEFMVTKGLLCGTPDATTQWALTVSPTSTAPAGVAAFRDASTAIVPTP